MACVWCGRGGRGVSGGGGVAAGAERYAKKSAGSAAQVSAVSVPRLFRPVSVSVMRSVVVQTRA